MPAGAWWAAAGVLVFCLAWRLGWYVLWRGTFGGRPVARARGREEQDAPTVYLGRDGLPRTREGR